MYNTIDNYQTNVFNIVPSYLFFEKQSIMKAYKISYLNIKIFYINYTFIRYLIYFII